MSYPHSCMHSAEEAIPISPLPWRSQDTAPPNIEQHQETFSYGTQSAMVALRRCSSRRWRKGIAPPNTEQRQEMPWASMPGAQEGTPSRLLPWPHLAVPPRWNESHRTMLFYSVRRTMYHLLKPWLTTAWHTMWRRNMMMGTAREGSKTTVSDESGSCYYWSCIVVLYICNGSGRACWKSQTVLCAGSCRRPCLPPSESVRLSKCFCVEQVMFFAVGAISLFYYVRRPNIMDVKTKPTTTLHTMVLL